MSYNINYMYALFNKDGEFISYAKEPFSDFLFQKISSHHSDLTKWKWFGTHSDGQMIPIFWESFFLNLKSKYPIDTQINLLITQIKKIVEYLPKHIQDDKFCDMAEKFSLADQLLKNTSPELNSNHASIQRSIS